VNRRTACALAAGLLVTLSGAQADMDSRDTDSPFGVLTFLDWNHDWNDRMYNTPLKLQHAVEMIEKAGVGMVRQVISWDEVEPQQGTWQFDRYDQILKLLDEHQVKMLAVLCYTAGWTGQEWNSTPDRELFVAYVRQVVRRYKDRIKYWELWNEPDQRTYWQSQDGMKSYVELLRAVYPAIKQEDPTAIVVLGSVNTPFPLRDMYRQGAKEFFDIANVHPFVSPLHPEPLRKVHDILKGVRNVMQEFGDTVKPVWFTELGCPGVPNPAESQGWWEGKSPSEQAQAGWVGTIYHEMPSWEEEHLQRIFWAFFQETKHFGNDIDAFGLIRRDFSPKPAYEAYQKAAESWASAQAAHE
jgi:hypothetical protein